MDQIVDVIVITVLLSATSLLHAFECCFPSIFRLSPRFFRKHQNQHITMAGFSLLRWSTKKKKTTSAAAPAPALANTRDISPPPYQEPETIAPTSVPQWLWTNAQCREWVFQLCVETLGLSVEESRSISDRFDGYGPNIYTMTTAGWEGLLGTKQRGCGVYSAVLSMRDRKGAVPKNVRLTHAGQGGKSSA